MDKQRKIDFLLGIFDEVSETIKEKIKRESDNCEVYGLGVYTDEVVIEQYMTCPSKNIQERIESAKQIEGVDFVFPVNSTEAKEVKKIVEQACIEILKNK